MPDSYDDSRQLKQDERMKLLTKRFEYAPLGLALQNPETPGQPVLGVPACKTGGSLGVRERTVSRWPALVSFEQLDMMAIMSWEVWTLNLGRVIQHRQNGPFTFLMPMSGQGCTRGRGVHAVG